MSVSAKMDRVSTRASAVFDEYAGLKEPDLPWEAHAELQVKLSRWQERNFGQVTTFQNLAGITEEVGELAHAILKNSQSIRGLDDSALKTAAGDAIADATIFQIQLCTALGLDWWSLVSETALHVMERDWVNDPSGGKEGG